MGNVLDCSTDPLDQIHESDGGQPTEVGPGPGSDDTRSQSSSLSRSYPGSNSAAGGIGDRRNVGPDGVGDVNSPQRQQQSEVLYLEKSVPLRDSIMWKLQREYYSAHHVQCWEKMVVPCFVTSNSFIARAYARVLVGFMRDWFLYSRKADKSEPLVILEIGAGHGKFSCLVLQHLLEMREFLPTLTPSRKNFAGANASNGVAKRGGDGDEPSQEQGQGQGREKHGRRVAGHSATTDGGEEPDGTTTIDGGADCINATEAEAVAAEEGEEDTSKNEPGSSIDVDVEKARATAAPAEAAAGGLAWQERGAADGLPFRYVVTDVAQGTLDYVQSHPSMQTFLDMGILEVALLDAEERSPPSELLLQVSGQTVNLEALKNPVATVCNYVFDSLMQDAFRVKGDKGDMTLYENRVTITATKPLPQDLSKLSLMALQGLALRWEHRPHAVPADQARTYYAGVAACATGEVVMPPDEAEAASLSATNAEKQTAKEEEEGEAEVGEPPSPTPDHGVQAEEDGVTVADQGGSSAAHSSEGESTRVGPGAQEDEFDGQGYGQGDEREGSGGDGEGDGEGGGGEDGARTSSGAGVDAAGDDTDKIEGRKSAEVRSNDDADFDDLLASYLDGPGGEEDASDGGGGGGIFGKGGGSLLMPLGALRLLRHLSSLSGGRGLILVGDKGYVSDEEMKGERDPHIAYHGSLSCMVNLDALARYTLQRGGWSLSSPYMEGFKCQVLAFGMEEGSLQETRFAFEDSTQAFGPESFSTLQRAVKDDVSQPSLGLVVQLLRLSRLDPDVFMKFRASLVDKVSSQELPPPIWEDLRKDTAATAQRCYPLQQGKDVNFEAARLLMALKDFEAALVLFRRSESISGEHNVTCHNMGMSYFYLGKLKEAKECFERSVELDETYEDSIRWLAHVERSMVPPALAAATAATRPSGVELRDAAALVTGGSTPSVDAVAKTLSI